MQELIISLFIVPASFGSYNSAYGHVKQYKRITGLRLDSAIRNKGIVDFR